MERSPKLIQALWHFRNVLCCEVEDFEAMELIEQSFDSLEKELKELGPRSEPKVSRTLSRIYCLEKQVADLVRLKDSVYTERNKLVALLSKMFPASIERHVGEDWDDDWRNIIYIQLPTGQVSWHIHDSEVSMFRHLRSRDWQWDGHKTDEKYRRVDSVVNRQNPTELCGQPILWRIDR